MSPDRTQLLCLWEELRHPTSGLLSTAGTLTWARTLSHGLEERAWEEELWREVEAAQRRVGKGILVRLQNKTDKEVIGTKRRSSPGPSFQLQA